MYFTPSHTVTNSAKYKTEAWKRYQVIKTRKKKSKKKQLMELATYSVLVGRKAKVEPHQFYHGQSPTSGSSSMPSNIIAPKI
jgi:hypothetical protein